SASEIWISPSLLVSIPADGIKSAALKLASGIFTICAFEKPHNNKKRTIELFFIIKLRNTYSSGNIDLILLDSKFTGFLRKKSVQLISAPLGLGIYIRQGKIKIYRQ